MLVWSADSQTNKTQDRIPYFLQLYIRICYELLLLLLLLILKLLLLTQSVAAIIVL